MLHFGLLYLYCFLFVTEFLGLIVKDESLEMISLYSVLFNFGDRIVFSMEPSVQNIPLEEVICWFFHSAWIGCDFSPLLQMWDCFYLVQGRCLDVKLTLDKIWILKDDELVSHTLSTNIDEYATFSVL